VLVEAADGRAGPLDRLQWTGCVLHEDVQHLAAAFRAAGFPSGATVLVVVENSADLLLYLLGLCRAGFVPAPVNPRLKGEEIEAVAEATGALGALVDLSRLDLVRHTNAGARIAVVDGEGDGVFDLQGWRYRHPGARIPEGRLDPGKTAIYLTTSGTTGRPKAAALGSRGLLAPFSLLAALPFGRTRAPRGERDRLLSALPLTHAMGLAVMLGSLSTGIRWMHLPQFDPEVVLDAIERRRANVFVGVPTMFADLEAAGCAERDLSRVQLWISGADRMLEDRARRFQEYGAAVVLAGRPMGRAIFVDTYGMVELSGPAALRVFFPAPPGLSLRTPYRLLPGMEARAVDAEGGGVGFGRVGELQFRGVGVLREYRGHASAGPDAAGWFSSGDHGRVWPGKLFTFAGRHRDRLKVGGFSVFPAEVEAVLMDHPDIFEVALVGVPDDRIGERPVAVVVPSEAPFDEAAFLEWAREQVAGYRRPREVVVVDSLPRGANAKLDRDAATAMAVEALDRRG
jgi:acyl-CoA synthetase (AMP-forming)/AMP-acid ligase II